MKKLIACVMGIFALIFIASTNNYQGSSKESVTIIVDSTGFNSGVNWAFDTINTLLTNKLECEGVITAIILTPEFTTDTVTFVHKP